MAGADTEAEAAVTGAAVIAADRPPARAVWTDSPFDPLRAAGAVTRGR